MEEGSHAHEGRGGGDQDHDRQPKEHSPKLEKNQRHMRFLGVYRRFRAFFELVTSVCC